MANRPKGYGFSREVADRMSAKYSDEDEREIVAWICAITKCDPPAVGREVWENQRRIQNFLQGLAV